MARLYHALWRHDNKFQIVMKAHTGEGHNFYAAMWADLSAGRWPGATTANKQHAFTLRFRDQMFTLVMCDYPGEVFSRAFMGDASSLGPAEQELLGNLQRAEALLVCVDPAVAFNSSRPDAKYQETTDQDFGLAEALRQLRLQPGGSQVPVALVVTKCDAYTHAIKSFGPLDAFVAHFYPNLLQASSSNICGVFPASAVKVRRSVTASNCPDWSGNYRFVVEPLKECLVRIWKRREQAEKAEIDATKRENTIRQEHEAEATERKENWKIWLTIGISVAFAVLAMALLLWLFWKKL